MTEFYIPVHKVFNAYLLEGEDQDPLLDAVMKFALALLKDEKKVKSRNHPDLIFVSHEKPNIISVDDVRKQITDTADIRPYSAEYKIYVILEADKMNQQAQNALLKTMEEPPSYVVVILMTHNRKMFLPTILSRCIELKLPDPTMQSIVAGMEEKAFFHDTVQTVCNSLYLTSVEILGYLKRLREAGGTAAEALDVMELYIRDVFYYKATRDLNGVYLKSEHSNVISLAEQAEYERLGAFSDAIDRAKRRISANVNEDMALENLMFVMRKDERNS